jgi:hypothetical protein
MKQYIVFNAAKLQFIVTEESWVRAIQAVLAHTDSLGQPFASDSFTAHALSQYPAKYQSKLLSDSVVLS